MIPASSHPEPRPEAVLWAQLVVHEGFYDALEDCRMKYPDAQHDPRELLFPKIVVDNYEILWLYADEIMILARAFIEKLEGK